MSLARCPVETCRAILDIPEIPYSWRVPDGRCCACAGVDPKSLKTMEIPAEVVQAVVKPKKQKGGYNTRKFVGEIKIERGGPPPPVSSPGNRTHKNVGPMLAALRAMKPPRGDVYDTFFAKTVDNEAETKTRLQNNINSAVFRDRKAGHLKGKFTTRCEDGGVRVWRVE
jgi:hypothetical protein